MFPLRVLQIGEGSHLMVTVRTARRSLPATETYQPTTIDTVFTDGPPMWLTLVVDAVLGMGPFQ